MSGKTPDVKEPLATFSQRAKAGLFPDFLVPILLQICAGILFAFASDALMIVAGVVCQLTSILTFIANFIFLPYKRRGQTNGKARQHITTKKIADSMKPGSYSSREFIYKMGEYLEKNGKNESFVHEAYKKQVPIFCPAFSDSSAGFGLVFHQTEKKQKSIAIDSVADFRELTEIKVKAKDTGLLMIGGGVPKNFVQDTVVAADVMNVDSPMHKYAVQLTVADERDGGLSGSTLKEANSWGKVGKNHEQMVFSEATITFPLLASYAYHKGSWKNRKAKKLNNFFK